MKLRSLLAIVLSFAIFTSPVLAQSGPGSDPWTIPKGGTAASTASGARTNLGLAIGSNVEAWDADLDCLAALATTGVLQRTGSGTCAALSGVSTNVRSAYTSANPMATTDCGKTVALGGSAFFTFTVNAASGYNASCAVIITNEDNVCPVNGASTCRGKTIAINGYASFILWPGQTFTLINQNNVWQYDQPGRWQPLVGMTWHVNHATGSDAGDGLGTSGTGEFATLQRCVNVMESLIDFGQADVGPTCQNDNETFTENNVVHTHPLTGYHVISINGNTASPSSVVWQVSGSGNIGTQCRDGGNSIVTGVNFVSTGTGNFFINGGQLGVCDFGSIIFGANSGGYDLFQTPGGSMNFFGGTLSITGSMTGFVLMEGEGHVLIDGATVTMPNALTFTNFFQLSGPSLISATSMVFSGPGAGAGSTGRQWLIDHTSNLNVTSSTIPGNSVGIYNCTPIVNTFTSGTNAAFAPSTCNGLLPATLEFELQGGGGGGAGSGTAPVAASNGNPSCLSLSGVACTSPVYQAGGGLAGTSTVGNVVAGGTVSGSGSCDDAISGASVGSASNQVNTPGSPGGSSFYGGAGAQGFSTAGADAAANSGSGGGGGGVGGTGPGGGGGSPGAWCRKMITNPVAAYVYTVGPLANGGTAGTGGSVGGKGAAGRVKFIQRWQ